MNEEGTGVIEAAFVTAKMLVDGTLRVSFDVEPRNAKAAFDLFHVPGVPAALAALVVGGGAPAPAEAPAPAPRKQPAQRERMAPLCEWAVMRCAEPQFQQWAADRWGSGDLALVVHPEEVVPKTREEWAKYVLCLLCEVSSRKELDTNPEAAQRFHERVRKPYTAWLEQQKVPA